MTLNLGISLMNRKSTKGYPLINLHVIPNNGGFSNHNSSSMINKETLAYMCPWINVDSSFAMSQLRKYSRNKRNACNVKQMGNPVGGNGKKAWVHHGYLLGR